jgi:hypothetical protein
LWGVNLLLVISHGCSDFFSIKRQYQSPSISSIKYSHFEPPYNSTIHPINCYPPSNIRNPTGVPHLVEEPTSAFTGRRIFLVGVFNPSEKYEFVSWDDESPNMMGKS